jgi:hypothetical protein
MRNWTTVLGTTAIVALLAPWSTQAEEAQVGTVFQREFWGAEGVHASGPREKLYYDTDVYASETVETGNGGGTALRFLDGTTLQVGGNSSVVLDKFVYDPSAGTGEAAITFGKGIFRFVSGAMENEEAMALKTPTATMTIRGTSFILYVAADGSSELIMIDGIVDVLPCGGEPATGEDGDVVLVDASCTGAVVGAARTAPRDPFVDRELPPSGDEGGDDSEQPPEPPAREHQDKSPPSECDGECQT